jgi:hypothetical protein
MSGATQVTIDITVKNSFLFVPGPFLLYFYIDNVLANSVLVNSTLGNTFVSTTLTGLAIPPGNHGYIVVLNTVSYDPIPTNGQIPSSFTLLFDDDPSTLTLSPIDMSTDVTVSGFVALVINCLHGSSMIQMRDGVKRLDQIQINDEVQSYDLYSNLAYAKVKNVSQCWLSFMGTDHDAIIFEPNSLGPNQPNQQLIIDPGHPICTKEEYLKDGHQALRPAGTYWEELDQVLIKKWTDIFVQNEPSVRYDLILEEPFNTYIANGIIVRAKGYKDHRYKQFV